MNKDTTHHWGDGWEGWPTLHKAMEEIDTRVYEAGYTLIFKEKYGSIRYEHVIDNKEANEDYKWDHIDSWKVVTAIVLDVADKYRSISDEILEDIAAREEIVGQSLHDFYWRQLGNQDE